MWQFAEAVARPRRRLPRARHPGHRRQRQLLQPDRRDGDPTRRRSSACSASSTTSSAAPRWRFGAEGDVVLLLGDTRDELGGSEWAHVVHGHLGGLPPSVDLAAERVLAEVLVDGARDQLLRAAHDLSEGGLAQALVEMALRGGIGVHVEVPAATRSSRCSPSRRRARSSSSSPADERGAHRARRVARGAGRPARHRRWRRRRRSTASSASLDELRAAWAAHAARAVRPRCRLTPWRGARRSTSPSARAALDGQWALLRSWVAALPRSEYAAPSVLDGWTVGDLVGHVSRTLLLFETLEPASGAVTPLSIGGYVSAYAGVADEIRDRAVDTARPRSLTTRSAALDATWATRRPLIDALRPGEVMAAMRGPIRSGDLVATRVIECVVHADDLSQSAARSRAGRPRHRARWPWWCAPCWRSSPSATRATRSRSGSRRSGSSSASRDRGTPAARRPTSSRRQRSPGSAWPPGGSAWAEAVHAGDVRASGERADLAGHLPLL